MTSDKDDGVVSRVVAGTKASLVARALHVASNVVLVVLLARTLLSPERFGLLYFALSVLGVASVFTTLGLPKSTARYVTEYVEQDPTQIRYILRRSLLWIGLVSGLSSLALAVGGPPLARRLGEPTAAPLLVAGTSYLLAFGLNEYLTMVFQGFNRVTWSATLTAVSSVARVLFAVAFVVAGLDALGALLGYVVGYLVADVLGLVVLYREYYTAFEAPDRPEAGLIRRLLRYSVPLTVTKGANVLDKQVDIILVGYLLNPVAVGYYVVAKQISNVLSTPAQSFGFSISPAYGEQKASQRVERAARLYESALVYVLLLYVPACAGLVLVAEPTVELVFGSEYGPATPVVQVFAGFVLVNAVNKVTNDGLDYLGRARSRALVQSIMAVTNFGLNLLLIPVFGVPGAAIATVATYTVYTLANVYFIHQELAFDVRRVLWNGAVVGGIALGVVAVVVPTMGYVSGPITLAAVVLVGAGVWAALSVLTGLLEVQRLASLLK